jgi:hypothetical protein
MYIFSRVVAVIHTVYQWHRTRQLRRLWKSLKSLTLFLNEVERNLRACDPDSSQTQVAWSKLRFAEELRIELARELVQINRDGHVQAPIVLWFEFKWQRAMAVGHEAMACISKNRQSPRWGVKVTVEDSLKDSRGVVKTDRLGSTSLDTNAHWHALWKGEKLQAHRLDNHERSGAYPTVTVTDDLAWYQRVQAMLPSFGVEPGGEMQNGSGI